MYTNFIFEKRNNEILGYDFPCENPSHVLCIVHGVGEYAHRYVRFADYLNKAGIAVIAMDLRGHGGSKGKRGHTAPREKIIEDIDEMIRYTKEKYPDIPLTLYGHSMGGNLVLDYIYRGNNNNIPDSFVVSAPWVELVRPVSKGLYIGLKFLTKLSPSMTISSGCDESKLGNPEYVRPYVSDKNVHDKISVQTALDCYQVGVKLEEGTLENNHQADNTPVLLMHGDADQICSVEGARKVAEQFKERPDFEYKEWPGYYHEIHNGNNNNTGEEPINKVIDFVMKH